MGRADHLREGAPDPQSVRTKRTLGFVLLYLRFTDAREICDSGLEIARNLALLEWKAMTYLAEGPRGARGVIHAVTGKWSRRRS
jgi:hypothetical protein